MASLEIKRKLGLVALLVLPAAGVKLAGAMLIGPGPSQAGAASSGASSTISGTAGTALPAWSAKQLAAAEHAESLRDLPFGPTPLYYEETLDVDPPPTPIIESDPVIEVPDIPQFTLQAVMAGGSGVKAVINGRPYVIGEELRNTGWILTAIDVDGLSATLTDHDQQRSVTIKVETPLTSGDP